MELPSLYHTDPRGKERVWSIWTEGEFVVREWGTVDGKKQRSRRRIQGVNQKNKNRTSPQEQAKRTAERDWTRKLTSGYQVSSQDSKGQKIADRVLEEHSKHGGRNHTSSSQIRGRPSHQTNLKIEKSKLTNQHREIIAPMLAKKWDGTREKPSPAIDKNLLRKHPHIYLQPKLDGCRCLVSVVEGKIILSTRGRKQLAWFSDHRKELEDLIRDREILDGLDGELYPTREEAKETTFSSITSICSSSRLEPHPDQNRLKLHLFDLVDRSGKVKQEERLRRLEEIFSEHPGDLIRLVESIKVSSYAQINHYHQKWVEEGLEGVIIRSPDCYYRTSLGNCRRSNQLIKCKWYDDDEFEVVGTDLDPGLDSEYFVWILKTKEGIEFRAKPEGTREQRRRDYQTSSDQIGKWLKVRYQGISKENGAPRFPIGIGIRPDWDRDET